MVFAFPWLPTANGELKGALTFLFFIFGTVCCNKLDIAHICEMLEFAMIDYTLVSISICKTKVNYQIELIML